MIDSPKSLTEQMLNFTERVASEMRAVYNKIGNPVRKVNNVEPDSNGDVTIDTGIRILDCYPIGSIYMSVNSTSPAELFGGTWEALDQGRVLIGAGTTYPAGSEGGEATHTLTTDEMPSHTHSGSIASAGDHTHTRGSLDATGSFIAVYRGNSASGVFSASNGSYHTKNGTDSDGQLITLNLSGMSGSTSSSGSHTHSMSLNTTGSGAAHNIMQPYLSVYMWKRTA